MLRTPRLLAACLATTALAFSAGAGAHVVSASFETSLRIVATCSVSVAHSSQVAVDCANASTPWLLDAPAAPARQVAGPDAQRVTVYF